MNNSKDNRQIQLQLKKSFPGELRNELRFLLNSTSIPLLITDTKLKILLANPAFQTLTGYSVDSLQNKRLSGLISPANISSVRKMAIRKSTALSALPVEIKTSDDNVSTFSVFFDQASYETSSVYLLFFLPVEAGSKQLDSDLAMTESLQAAGKTGLFQIDIKRHRFHGSAGSFALLGLNVRTGSTEVSNVTDLIYKKSDREKMESYFLAPDPSRDFFETEFRIKAGASPDDQIKTIRIFCCTDELKTKNKITGFIRDITAEKKVEKELLKAKNKAERANRFKAVFLTNLSHELRTPMNAILGFSELLKAEQSSNELVNDYLSIIRNKGNYLLSLVDDVIELSRFETGDITIRKTKFRINSFMDELFQEFVKRREEKDKVHIELHLDMPVEYKDISIFTDSGRLHQVLASILSNALKFTEKGRVDFGFFMSAKNYKFYVSDTGIGLSKDDQRHIFNRFEEIEDTALTRLGGTGLSLTIAKKIIEQLGGKIKVRSELNKGSWFQISIPIEAPVKKKTDMINETGRIHDLNWKDKVILIAEDEELNFRFLEAVLQRTHAKVLRANNGMEAVDLCKTINHIDMILMDIKMPVMSGNDATIEIKKLRPELPVIAQTAFSIQEEIAKCKNAGCDDFLTKPIDIKLLIRKMSLHFQK